MFDSLGASDEQLDFPVIYTSATKGLSGTSPDSLNENMEVLFNLITEKVSAPDCSETGPFQMQVISLDYSSYVGAIAVGKVKRGSIKRNTAVKVVDKDGVVRNEKILKVFGHQGLERVEVEEGVAGDIIALCGIARPLISDTICHPDQVEQLPALTVDEPTLQMILQVNDSPFAGKEGKFLTSRQIKDRLEKELLHNVALRVEETEHPDKFRICGRGELHISILLENMRREGYEFAIGKPEVIMQEKDGKKQELYEHLVVDIALRIMRD